MTSSEFYSLRDTLENSSALIRAHVDSIDNDNDIISRTAARKWLLIDDDIGEALSKIDGFLNRLK